jgi:hypothetical protein
VTLTEEESRELLESVRFLRQRSNEYFADFKMEEIPKSRKASLPDLLEWWDDRTKTGKRTRFVLPILLTFVSPVFCGVVIVIVTKIFHL